MGSFGDLNYEEPLLGTASAIRLAANRDLLDDKFFVLYEDSYLPIFAGGGEGQILRFGPCGAHDWHPQRRQLGPEQRILPERIAHALRQAVFGPARQFRYIDYGLTVLRNEVHLTFTRLGEVSELSGILHDLSTASHPTGFQEFEDYPLTATSAP